MILAFAVMHKVDTVRKIDGLIFGSCKECGKYIKRPVGTSGTLSLFIVHA